MLHRLVVLVVVGVLPVGIGSRGIAQVDDAFSYEAPGVHEMFSDPASQLAPMLERYSTDRSALRRLNGSDLSPVTTKRLGAFYDEWNLRLSEVDFDTLSQDGKIDYILFRNHLEYERRQLDIEDGYVEQMAELIPFASIVTSLDDARRRMEPVNPRASADAVSRLAERIAQVQEAVQRGLKEPKDPEAEASQSDENGDEDVSNDSIVVAKTVANRAVAKVNELRRTLRDWHGFYDGYDPLFNWWMDEPYERANKALADYSSFLSRQIVGIDPNDESEIIGDPIGRAALLSDLEMEMIPYTPEELIEIANKEFAWCEAEMLKASRELGFGDDWHAALEHVKTLHVEPGQQTELIRELAFEAVDFLEEHDLVTIPEFCKQLWRIDMMSPSRQLITPFFTGGEVISVAFPTDTMTHEQKLMSMRGNNRHFSRATVHHELIPGHHLQGYMTSRHMTYRGLFSTPFWGEGWALYWEMLLWDYDFQKSPEDRIGMLFWRSHRCARIIFSLSYHLEEMTAQECVDFLVDRVGHERANAAAEVRRSVGGLYSPLYQCAYMLGGLQFRALHKDLVESGTMTNREFHDAILRMNRIPVAMIRAKLKSLPLTPDHVSDWRFYDE